MMKLIYKINDDKKYGTRWGELAEKMATTRTIEERDNDDIMLNVINFYSIFISYPFCVFTRRCVRERGQHKIYRTIVGRWSDCLEEKSSNLQFLSVVYLHMSCEFRLKRKTLCWCMRRSSTEYRLFVSIFWLMPANLLTIICRLQWGSCFPHSFWHGSSSHLVSLIEWRRRRCDHSNPMPETDYIIKSCHTLYYMCFSLKAQGFQIPPHQHWHTAANLWHALCVSAAANVKIY